MSEIKAIVLPKMGMSMQEGRVVEWNAKEGDNIKQGDEIAEVESEKIVNSLEAITDGVIRRMVVTDDEFYPVGKLLAVVADDATTDAEIDTFVAEFESDFAKELESRPKDTGPTSVEIKSRNIEYTLSGDDDPTTVFIHGTGAQKESWMLTQSVVSELGRTLAVDLPGHGGSSKSVDTGDLDELASYVIGVMDELGINSAHFVGHSLGAVVSSHIAKIHPQRVASVFLISAAGPGTEVNPELLGEFAMAESRRDVKKSLGYLFADNKFVTRELVQATLKSKRIEGVSECLGKISIASGVALAGENPSDTLAAIEAPISIVWGREDVICPVSNTEGLPEKVKLTIIDNAGHMPQVEAMDEVNGLILEHIKSFS